MPLSLVGCVRLHACPLALPRPACLLLSHGTRLLLPCHTHTRLACVDLAAVPAGNTALSGHYLPVVPYKLLHAYALAELGRVQQAMAYCGSMNNTLQVRWCGATAG